ncbi:MAG: amidohydrolase family protein [Bacteroidota bacterium]
MRSDFNTYDGRVKYAAAPRFVLSCSEKLLRETSELVQSFDGMLLHTHASENKNEIAEVKKMYDKDNIAALHSFGALSEKTVLAHCVHLNSKEISLLQKTKTNIAHCPSSNLKLASGIANTLLYKQSGINVSLGADGAPCNNNLSVFQEMRFAALLQKPLHGATALDAKTVFEMATVNGAKALGLSDEIGSLETGRKADIVLLDLNNVWNPVESYAENLYSTIVYSATAENIHSVMIDGRWVVRNKELIALDEKKILETAKRELKKLMERV